MRHGVARTTVLLLLTAVAVFLTAGCQQIREQRKAHYIEEGTQLLDQGEYGKAARAFKNAQAFDRDAVEISELLGEAYYRAERWADAAHQYGKVSAERPDDEALALRHMECQVLAQKYYNLVDRAGKYLQQHPENERVRLLYITGAVKSRVIKFVDKALVMLGEIQDAGELTPQLQALRAEALVLRGRLSEAEAILRQYPEKTEEWLSAVEVLAEKYALENNQETVVELYEQLLLVVGSEAGGRYRKNFLGYLREYGMAERELRLLQTMLAEAGADEENDLVVRYAEACMYYGRYREGHTALARALQRSPDDFHLNRTAIALYQKERDWERAIAAARTTLARIPEGSPRRTEIMSMLADLSFEKGDYDTARAISQEVLEIEPTNALSSFVQCKIMIEQGNLTTVVGRLRLLIGSNLEEPAYHYYLGLAYERQGIDAMAEKAFLDALETDPGYRPALEKVLDRYGKKEYWREMVEVLDGYLARHPDDAKMQELMVNLREKTFF